MASRTRSTLAATLAAWALLAQATPPATGEGAAAKNHDRLVRDGLAIEFEARPVEGPVVTEGHVAEVRFRITEEATGNPVKGVTPAAWLDIGYNIEGKEGERKECRDKVSLYLKGIVGIRPMLDLNGYHLLVLNKDPSITVVDPVVTMAGRTSTLAVVVLRRPPMDWAKSRDEKQIFVTMPVANQVAVVDTQRFVVTHNVDAGKNPVRIALQPDGRYLWVGNNAPGAADSGVTVIDAQTHARLATIPTGRGHHEIAFSDDSRHAFVSNRDDGNVSVIDVATLAKLKDIGVGAQLLSVAYSRLSRAVYAVDGKGGSVAVIDAATLEPVARIAARPGLGPLRISADGRWAMVANTREDQVLVIDAATNQVVHEVPVGAEPFQITFSRAFAYVRSLGTEKVSLINLASLGAGRKPIVNTFAAGDTAPKLAGDLPIADGMTTATTESAAFVVNPADNTTYFYMEGMNAPMSNYKSFGHVARAATLVDRSLKEVEPGVYATKVRIPVDGRYDVALMLDTPRLLHCFSMNAERNPLLHLAGKWEPRFVDVPAAASAAAPLPLRFRLLDPATGEQRKGVSDAVVTWYRAPGFDRQRASAREVEPGLYEALLRFAQEGAHYAFVEVPSLKLRHDDSAFVSLRVGAARVAAGPGAGDSPDAKGKSR